jgi:hypothetical protein
MLMVGLGLAALVGCSQPPTTGVALQARVGTTPFDELRFGVSGPPSVDSFQPSPTIVDPDTAGRLRGPFAAGQPELIFDLPDELADQKVLCDIVALSNGIVTARGDRIIVVEGGAITAVNVFLSPNVTADGPADQAPPPTSVPGQVMGEAPIP